MNEVVKSTDIHIELVMGYNLKHILKCSKCKTNLITGLEILFVEL